MDPLYRLTEEERLAIEEEMAEPDFDEIIPLDNFEIQKVISETQFAKEINKNGNKYLDEINIKVERVSAEREEIISWILLKSKKKKYRKDDFMYYNLIELRNLKSL